MVRRFRYARPVCCVRSGDNAPWPLAQPVDVNIRVLLERDLRLARMLQMIRVDAMHNIHVMPSSPSACARR